MMMAFMRRTFDGKAEVFAQADAAISRSRELCARAEELAKCGAESAQTTVPPDDDLPSDPASG